jgi:hypothetical protein
VDLKEFGFGCVDWIHLIQDMGWWHAVEQDTSSVSILLHEEVTSVIGLGPTFFLIHKSVVAESETIICIKFLPHKSV